MDILELLKTVRPAWGEDWVETFKTFQEDPDEAARIEELAADILENGLLAPGRIGFNEADEDDPEEYHYLGNGTHRFYVAILLGWDDYPVVSEAELEDETDAYWKSTEIVLDVSKKDWGSDELDLFFDRAVSRLNFRLADGVWVENAGMSSQGTGIGYSITLNFTAIDEEHFPALVSEVLKRMDPVLPRKNLEYLVVNQSYMFKDDFVGI